MPCYRPVTAWRPASGGGPVSFREVKDYREFRFPCGRCIGCRIRIRDAWAFRCYAESRMHARNSFITLTYDEQHYPQYGSLNYRDWQLFAKKLRNRVGKFRFFMCGEYGEQLSRPHFHALLFGLDFDDRVKSNSVYSKHDLYTSELLDSCWGKGFANIGEVTFESARYCAVYTTKRITGDRADEHYSRVDTRTGEIIKLEPEFGSMSLKPGIGATWIQKYWPEVVTHGCVHVQNRKLPVPRYFDQILENKFNDGFEGMKLRRQEEVKKFIDDCTYDRLAVRERVAYAKRDFNRERYGNAL